jgi:DNA ligase D-like protein (predicted polymerase)/DNA ligase D-like protein (predicted 3'-phosphoesterase)
MQSPLATYRRKRDFHATPEPGPRVARRKAKGLLFVVQRHQARRLHYDFRLELDGVLKSWAVTREPSRTPGDKRLAVQVEDHPVAYAGFHGDIPAGHYGAGHVDIWDRGTWTPEGDPHAGLRDGHLDFTLAGKRLRGRFVLVRMKGREDRNGKRERDNWLLIPRSDEVSRTRAPRARKAAASAKVTVAGVAITHAERALPQVPEAVKADLARYYEAVGGWFMPQIADRPLALIKCPGGDFASCFFAKHAGDPRRARERPDDDPPYMHLATLRAAIEAVQNGAIEFHTWGVRFPKLDRPDRLVLDLDPDAEVDWPRFREAAQSVRALLDRLELAWFLKTTGGKGLHFVLPLTRRHSWDDVKAFAAAIARRLAADAPDMFIATASKARRKGLVFVDWLRNTDGATAVAAYSLRARPGLPVSMPIEWRELAHDVRGAHFDWRNVPQRLKARRRDPWAGYEDARQTLRASLLRAL